MAAPLDGIRVLEVANWLAAPAATRLMADMGADVIKVETPGAGDVFRGFQMRSLGYNHPFPTNYAFETDNLGKRSIAIDLDKAGGAELVRKLAADCDVFVTNLVKRRRTRFGLGWDDIRAVNANVVYASFSGYGTEGPDEDRPGFDLAAFWARSGIMGLLGEPDAPPPLCRGGQGDHSTSLNLLAAILAALRMKDRTGEAQLVEVTLQASGMWTLAGDFAAALAAKHQPPRVSRKAPTHPLWNSYECADGRWVLLINPDPFPRKWPAFCEMLGHAEWATDGRFDDFAKLLANSGEARALIDPVFASRELAHWGPRLDGAGLIWAPVATMPEVVNDPQVRAMGWIAEIDGVDERYGALNTPFKLHGSDTGARGRAPAVGEHTFEVLDGFGIAPDEVERLATNGVFG